MKKKTVFSLDTRLLFRNLHEFEKFLLRGLEKLNDSHLT